MLITSRGMGERDIDATIAENDFQSTAGNRIFVGWVLLAVAALGWLIILGHLANLAVFSYLDVDDWGRGDWAVLIGGPLCILPLAATGVALLAYGKALLRLRRHESYVQYLTAPPNGLATLSTGRASESARRVPSSSRSGHSREQP